MKLFSTRYPASVATIALILTLILTACQPITRPPAGAAPAQRASDAAQIPGVAAVQQALAQELKVDASTITLVSAELVEWPDSCLGIVKADEMCAAVITPGAKVVFQVGDQQYEYHLNGDGSEQRLVTVP
jgi:hypothetical protein